MPFAKDVYPFIIITRKDQIAIFVFCQSDLRRRQQYFFYLYSNIKYFPCLISDWHKIDTISIAL